MTKNHSEERTRKFNGIDESKLHEFVVEFRKYRTELNRKFLERKGWEPKDESKVRSFIPGTITKIYVEKGQHLDEGAPLMDLEAMKMKNTICTERAGTLLKINAAEGERVPKAKVIFEFDLD